MTANRDKIIKFRVTATEKAEIALAAKKQRLTTSEYIRYLHVTNVRQPFDSKGIETLKNAIATLAPIGNNLNQIARAINTNLASGLDIPESINLIQDLAELTYQVEQIKCDVKVMLADTMPRRTRSSTSL